MDYTVGFVLMLIFCTGALAQTVTLVNIIPASRSGETFQDSEPTLAVDPNNPLRMIATAISDDRSFGDWAPIFYSTDGGSTWAMASLIPSAAGATYMFTDPAFSFGNSGVIYAALLRGMAASPSLRPLSVLRKGTLEDPNETFADFGSDLRYGVDQPYVQSGPLNPGQATGNTVLVANDDSHADCPICATATVDQYMGATGTFISTRIATRGTSNRDGAPIRIAIDRSTLRAYGAFLARRQLQTAGGCTSDYVADVTVVRDDNNNVVRAFSDLVDGSDSNPGRIVSPSITLPSSETHGQDRFGYDVAIAVDPTTPSRIFLAWGDLTVCGGTYLLHVRRSDDGGVSWTGDLGSPRAFAKTPSLAVNSAGTVVLLYQQWQSDSNRWITQLERSTDEFVSSIIIFLANTPADVPAISYTPYLGDYTQLLAIGNDFYGMFSASNVPNAGNFDPSVQFQRNHDFVAQTLTDTNGNPVSPSIDPFFFKLTEPGQAVPFLRKNKNDLPALKNNGKPPMRKKRRKPLR